MASVTISIPSQDRPPVAGQIVSWQGGYFMVRGITSNERGIQVELISVTCQEARAKVGDLSFVPSINRYPEAG